MVHRRDVGFAGLEAPGVGGGAGQTVQDAARAAGEVDLIGDVEEAVDVVVAVAEIGQDAGAGGGQAEAVARFDAQVAEVGVAVEVALDRIELLLEGLYRVAGVEGGGVDLAAEGDHQAALEAGEGAGAGDLPVEVGLEDMRLAAEVAAGRGRCVHEVGEHGVDLQRGAGWEAVDDHHGARKAARTRRRQGDGGGAVVGHDTGCGEGRGGTQQQAKKKDVG